jgi:uncharacterized protein YfaS (alpha-2-macroglobulin family)
MGSRQVRVTARLTSSDNSGIASQTLTFYVKTTGGSVLQQTSATTDSNGYASVVFTVGTPGTYVFQVDYAGSDTYESATASQTATIKDKAVITLTVTPV